MKHQGAVRGEPRWPWAGAALICAALCLAPPAAAESPVVEAGAPAGMQGGGLLGAHSDLRFALLAPPRKQDDAGSAAYQAQVRRVAARLQAASKRAYPDASRRIGAFDVHVADTEQLSAMSSSTGKVALSTGIARLQPGDAWLAFVIAREMGHVIAGHHDSNAGASIAASVVMNLVLPGSGFLKSALSLGGSEFAFGSRRERQASEADQIAFKLLEAAGYTDKVVLRDLRLRPLAEDAPGAWAADFRASVARVDMKAPRKGPAATVPRGRDAGAAPAAVDLVAWRPGQAPRGRGVAASATASPRYAVNVLAADACGLCGSQP